MAKTLDQKQQVVKQTQENIKSSKIVIFTDYTGMSVEDMRNLRSKLLENGDKFTVIKNALIDIASQKEKYQTSIKEGKTQTAVVFGQSDEVVPAKVLVEFIKENEKPKVIGGLYDGQVIDEEAVKKLASVPSKDILQAKLVGTIAGPVSGMVNVLQGNIRGLINIINQYKDKLN